jgi:hypothetical protein
VAEQIGNLIQGQAPSVTVGAAEVFQVWNAFAKKPAREADMLRVERAYSGLRLGPPEQSATHAEILAALENYRDACNLPNSQAWPHPLPIFLTWEKIQKFLPSFYNQDNFDASKFGRGAEPAHECYRRGGQGCLNPGVHKHTDDTGADYWVCEMHEQQRRQLSARAREASV